MKKVFQPDVAIHLALHPIGDAVDDLRADRHHEMVGLLSPRLRVFIDWMAEQFRDRF